MPKKQKCQLCQKQVLKKNFKRHLQSCKGISQTKKRICPHCENIFSQKNLDRHIKNIHNVNKKIDKRLKKYKICQKAQNLISFFDPMPCYSEKLININEINHLERKCLSQDDKDFLLFKRKFINANNMMMEPYINPKFKHQI